MAVSHSAYGFVKGIFLTSNNLSCINVAEKSVEYPVKTVNYVATAFKTKILNPFRKSNIYIYNIGLLSLNIELD